MNKENEREHAEQIRIEEELKPCTRCGKPAILQTLIVDDDENEELCPQCWGHSEAQADYEYERQKEEGVFDPDNPDHERDIKED